MQPSNTTELQAVNAMLATIGEAPVDSLRGATSSDAALAGQVLTEVARETQALPRPGLTRLRFSRSPRDAADSYGNR